MSINSMILVVGATREETIHIETCLKDWKYDIIPVNVEGTGIDSPIPKTPILMLVYAQQDPKNTIALCEQLRKRPKSSSYSYSTYNRQIQDESVLRTPKAYGKYRVHHN